MSHTDNNPHQKPWLTVHALTEFVFCPRAGLITVETDSREEPEQAAANLDFSLPFTLDELEYRLARNLNRLWITGGASIVFLLAGVIGLWLHHLALAFVSGVALVLLAPPVARRVETVLSLVQQRRTVLEREKYDPPVEGSTRAPVNWWDFLNAGWMSIVCHQPHRDEEFALSGSPWRILRRGSVSIPVFKLTHYDATHGHQLFPQHVVRMAAYCHLIETCEGATSPCGVVLFGNTYEGVTLPNDAAAKTSLLAALQSAQQWLMLAADDDREPLAADPEFCSGCHWGQPIVYLEGATEHTRHGEPIPVFGTVAKDGRLYHSACGDRFTWKPRHDHAVKLGIG